MGQHAVNIVYPIDGETYSGNSYLTFSFSTTCPGGGNKVEWALDGTAIGNAEFYDQFSAQFCQKLARGGHTFYVQSSCGKNEVNFKVS